MSIIHCQHINNNSIVKVEEKASKALFDNKQNDDHIVTKNDNCVMTGALKRADFVIIKSAVGSLVIELKGRDVESALEQVESTIIYWKQNRLFATNSVAALIVCRQHPTAVPAQKALNKFKATYKNMKLKITTHCAGKPIEYYFELGSGGRSTI